MYSVVVNFVLIKIIFRLICLPGIGEELDLDQRPLVMQRGRLDPYHYYFEIRKKDGEEIDDTVRNKQLYFPCQNRDDSFY